MMMQPQAQPQQPMQAQQSMGIATPMQNPIQGRQSSAPVNNSLPPQTQRLVDIIEMQKRQAMMQAANNNGILGAPPPPGTIAEQEAQKMAQMQQQQMQQRPPQAGGLDQLNSGFTQGFADGGIVGFSKGPYSEGAAENGTVPMPKPEPEFGDLVGETERLLSILGSSVASWRDKQQAKAALERLSMVDNQRARTRLQRQEGAGDDVLAAPLVGEASGASPSQRGEDLYVPSTDASSGMSRSERDAMDARKAQARRKAKASDTSSGGIADLAVAVQGARSMGGDPSNVPTPQPMSDSRRRLVEQDAYAAGLDPDAAQKRAYDLAMQQGGGALRAQGLEAYRNALAKAGQDSQRDDSAFGIKGLGAFLRAGAQAKPTTEGGFAGNLAALAQGAEGSAAARDRAAQTQQMLDQKIAELNYKIVEAKAAGNDAAVKEAMDARDRAMHAKTQAMNAGLNAATTLDRTDEDREMRKLLAAQRSDDRQKALDMQAQLTRERIGAQNTRATQAGQGRGDKEALKRMELRRKIIVDQKAKLSPYVGDNAAKLKALNEELAQLGQDIEALGGGPAAPKAAVPSAGRVMTTKSGVQYTVE